MTDGRSAPWGRLAAGAVAGAAVATIDAVAFRGEVSPMVVVAVLLLATAAAGGLWGWRAWPAAIATWIPLPGTHVVKHWLGLPDTLQPNTLESIAAVAAFTLAVCAVGMCGGVMLRLLGADTPST